MYRWRGCLTISKSGYNCGFRLSWVSNRLFYSAISLVNSFHVILIAFKSLKLFVNELPNPMPNWVKSSITNCSASFNRSLNWIFDFNIPRFKQKNFQVKLHHSYFSQPRKKGRKRIPFEILSRGSNANANARCFVGILFMHVCVRGRER